MDVGTALSAVQTVLTALQTPQLREMWSVWGYKSELMDLQKSIATVKAVLLEAEAKQDQLSPAAKLYVEELKDAVYDADDLIDEFLTLAERKQQMKGGKISKKVRNFVSRFNPVGVALRMSEEVKRIRNKLEKIADDHNKFGLNLDNKSIRRRREETCSYVYANDIIGRDDDVENILDMLFDPTVQRDNDVSFLSIVGIGGLGKTALAQLLFNHEKVEEEFQLKLWTCVSDQDQNSLNVTEILGKILESALGRKHDASSLEVVQIQLREQLAEKKFLLVLDDVWTENREEWLKLERLLNVGQGGSWVLLTTRSTQTASIVGNGLTYELEGLSDDDSWQLFQRAAFAEVAEDNSSYEFVDIGKKIVERCASVPLAIRVVGSFLYGQDMSKWELVLTKGLANIRSDKNGIMPILKLSYDNLESALKSCFSYCALFPKDYEIEKVMLLRLWMAQGYVVPLDKGQSIEDAAHEYFCILLRRCFFQDVETNDGEIITCKIHDLMHDIAQEVSAKEVCELNSNTAVVHEKVRHLSVVREGLIENLSTKAQMRTYLQYKSCGAIDQPLANCVRLRALVLSNLDITTLPDSIGKLLHLRYLDLSWNDKLQVLPNTTTKLHNLETFIIKGCGSLKELPEKLGELVKLRVLGIEYCNLTCLPSSVGGLSQLHTLAEFYVGRANSSTVKQFNNELETLKTLNNLKGSLIIMIKVPENAKYVKKDNMGGAYLRKKEYLEVIGIRFEDNNMEFEEALLDEMQPHSNLKKFKLWQYSGGRMPDWANQDNLTIFLPHLVELEFYECRELRCLPLLGRLRHLKSLKIKYLPELEYVESDIKPAAATGSSGDELSLFPSLQELHLEGLPKLKGWRGRSNDGVGSNQSHVLLPSFPYFPQLKISVIMQCPEMRSFPGSPLVEDHLWALEELDISESPKLPLNEGEGGIPWRSLSHTLRSLTLCNLPELVNLPAGMQCLTSLHSLSIGCCKGLESLPDWMPSLTSLRYLFIRGCSAGLEERCQSPNGEDWPKIQHIPNIIITLRSM